MNLIFFILLFLKFNSAKRNEIQESILYSSSSVILSEFDSYDINEFYHTKDPNDTIKELGDSEGSTAFLTSNFDYHDAVTVSRCPGSNRSISAECYCSLTKMWDCPSGSFCLMPTHDEPCPPGYFCPENSFQPALCCGGYYCPSPDRMVICPEGHICVKGSIQPTPCTLGSCPQGSEYYIKDKAYYIILFTFICLIITQQWYSSTVISNIKHGVLASPVDSPNDVTSTSSSKLKTQKHTPSPQVKFSNVTVQLPCGKTLLQNVSGELLPGRVCAIMGPSGAGKSTLLNLLLGKLVPTKGHILIDDKPSDFSQIRHQVGYVPQDDIMLWQLTVYDILYYAALLRLPNTWSHQQKLDQIMETIELLGLTHVMHQQVGNVFSSGISGGQKKRVNIGIELVADPLVLLLDEPTTGLDTTTANRVCSFLQEISQRRLLTIAAVVHSPTVRAFLNFDDLILLGNGGRVVYSGPRAYVDDYFETLGYTCPNDLSICEFYLDIVSDNIQSDKFDQINCNLLCTIWEEFYDSFITCLESDSTRSKGFDAKPLISLVDKIIDDATLFKIDHTVANESKILDSSPSTQSNLNIVKDQIFGLVHFITYQLKSFIYNLSPSNILHSIRVFKICLNRSFTQILSTLMVICFELLMFIVIGLSNSAIASKNEFVGPLQDTICLITPIPLRNSCKAPILNIMPLYISNFINTLFFFSVMTSVLTIGLEKLNFFRERSSGVPTISYFLAKLISDMPSIILFSTIYSISILIYFPNLSNFIQIYVIILSMTFYGFSVGYFSSIIFPFQYSHLGALVIAAIWCVIFSGVGPAVVEVRERWGPFMAYILDCSPVRWSISALFLIEWEPRSHLDPLSTAKLDYGYLDDKYNEGLINIIKISIFWYIIAFFMLVWIGKRNQF